MFVVNKDKTESVNLALVRNMTIGGFNEATQSYFIFFDNEPFIDFPTFDEAQEKVKDILAFYFRNSKTYYFI